MPRTNNGDPHFKVHVAGAIAAELRRLQRRATKEGRGAKLIDAFRRIVKRLRDDPLGFGEPLYELPALRLFVRHAAIAPLVVYFAVHDEEQLVFIKSVAQLPE